MTKLTPEHTCPFTGELVILLANGGQIRSGWVDKDDPEALPTGDYISVLDAHGKQVFYIDSADLLADQLNGRRLLNDMLQACQGRKHEDHDQKDGHRRENLNPGLLSVRKPGEAPRGYDVPEVH